MYVAVALAAVLAEGHEIDTCALVMPEDDNVVEFFGVGSANAAICAGLKTSELLPLIVHVFALLWQSVLFSPHAKVVVSPSLEHGVMPTLAPGLSIMSQHQPRLAFSRAALYPIPVLQYPAHASLPQVLSVQLPRLTSPPP